MTIAAIYAEFAAREAHGVSPVYERLSRAVSRDDEVLALLGTLSLGPPIIVDESLSWARVGPARPIGGAPTGWPLWKPPIGAGP
jgi:hypothetical protein